MYKPTFDKYIDFQEEKTAIIEFCNKHWTIKENKEQFVELVDFLFDFGTRLATNRFNSVEISSAFRDLLKAEMDKTSCFEKPQAGMFSNYSKKSKVYFLIEDFERYSNSQTSLNYDNYMPKLLKEVKNQFPTLKTVKPVDWKKYVNNPDLLDDDSENESKFADFNGSKSNIGMYIWSSFPDEHTLSSIAYNDERGRKPFETLISSIVNQAYASHTHNNTVDMLNELNGIVSTNKMDIHSLEEVSSTIKSKPLKVLFDLASFDSKKNDPQDEEKFKQTILSAVEYGPEISSPVSKKNKM